MKELITYEVMPTKSNIEVVAKSIMQPLTDGTMDKHEVLVRSKFLIDVLTNVVKSIEITEPTTYLGAKIEPAETGTKYAYSENEQWLSIKEKMKPFEEQIKAIEEQIKIATKIGKSFVDESTGEMISPVTKTSTSSFKITLGK